MTIRTLYAITNSDQSVSVLDCTFKRVASWPNDYSSKPKRNHSQVMLNCWKHKIVWVD